ncbi:MAG TPA: PilZ domain-containing protein [Candidatus Limnocylindria bacterium]|nr:PilZ domain-containing protein [Candidatus Limnocylindria bacterium]
MTSSGVATEAQARESLALGALDGPIRRGLAPRLSFNLPDRGQPIDVVGLVVRVDRDGAAFWFLDLDPVDARRIDQMVKQTPPA